jgi:hypothetical protein
MSLLSIILLVSCARGVGAQDTSLEGASLGGLDDSSSFTPTAGTPFRLRYSGGDSDSSSSGALTTVPVAIPKKVVVARPVTKVPAPTLGSAVLDGLVHLERILMRLVKAGLRATRDVDELGDSQLGFGAWS